MRLGSCLAFATLVILVAVSSNGQTPAPVHPLHGVWSTIKMTAGGGGETTDPTQPGLFIFTADHYSAVYSLGGDPRPRAATSFNATSEEKIAQYDTIIVNTGSYDISGSTITFRPMIAKSPEFVGGQATMDFQIDGDVLTLTQRSVVAADGVSAPNAPGSSMTLRRIE